MHVYIFQTIISKNTDFKYFMSACIFNTHGKHCNSYNNCSKQFLRNQSLYFFLLYLFLVSQIRPLQSALNQSLMLHLNLISPTLFAQRISILSYIFIFCSRHCEELIIIPDPWDSYVKHSENKAAVGEHSLPDPSVKFEPCCGAST